MTEPDPKFEELLSAFMGGGINKPGVNPELAAGAAAMFAIYAEFTKAGFSADQAFQLLLLSLSASLNAQ